MSQSIGKILDELLSNSITKQQAVRKLMRNRQRYLNNYIAMSQKDGEGHDKKRTSNDS